MIVVCWNFLLPLLTHTWPNRIPTDNTGSRTLLYKFTTKAFSTNSFKRTIDINEWIISCFTAVVNPISMEFTISNEANRKKIQELKYLISRKCLNKTLIFWDLLRNFPNHIKSTGIFENAIDYLYYWTLHSTVFRLNVL